MKDKRRKLFLLLKQIIKDEKEFEQLYAHISAEHEGINLKNIPKAVENTEREYQLDNTLQQLKRMITEDKQLIHLLLGLRSKGLLHFRDGKDSVIAAQIFAITKDMLSKSRRIALIVAAIGKQMERQGTDAYLLTEMYDELSKDAITYKGKLKTFIDSEHKEVAEIEAALRNGVDISKRRLWEIKEGSFRIELHEGYSRIKYSSNDFYANTEGPFPFALLLFDYDYLVADIILKKYNSKEIFVMKSETYVIGKAYVEKAVRILLKTKTIQEWNSDLGISISAKKMYERLGRDQDFIVRPGQSGDFTVSLR